jgi:GNAT superfamily N-acetyltransferase
VDATVRRATPADGPFLAKMVAVAAAWRPAAGMLEIDEVMTNPKLAHYVTGWPRPGDLGVVAEHREPVGAAWLRLFTVGDRSYGFVDVDVPEISIGVVEHWRGAGIGTRLLEVLIDLAVAQDVRALSLSVERDNPARRIYQRLGFREIAAVGGSLTMLRQTH